MVVKQPDNISQEALIRASGGDMDAFCQIVDALEDRLLGQAFALCGDRETAEDLAQQTWVEAWKSLPRFDYSCRFTTWLYSILLHLYYKFLRQRRSRPISLAALHDQESESVTERLDSSVSDMPDPVEALSNKEVSDQWRAALEHLPEIHRDVVLLRYFEEASLEEIAAITGVSLNTVKTRLHHALKKLRRLTKTMNFPDSGGDT